MTAAAASKTARLASVVTYVSLASIAGLVLAAIAFCLYRAILPIEVDPNEAWNAWHSRSIGRLYPAPDGLITNNYPPIYFYILYGWTRLGFEPVYAGRMISIVALISLSVLVFRGVIVLGQDRLAAFAGAVWFAGTFAAGFTGYVGMNDPHLLAFAVMCGSFVWLIARENKGRAAEPAILLMAAAGFIKHNIVMLPVSGLIWLAFGSWRKSVRAALLGAAVCAIGLLLCYAAYGADFIAQLLFPREMTLKNALLRLPSAQALIPGAAVAALWLLFAGRGNPLAPRMAALLLLTFAGGAVQIFGEGVDVNAYFEFLFALGLGVGIAFGEAPNIAARIGAGAGILRSAFAALLLLGVALSFPPEPYRLIADGSFREELVENIDAVKSEVKRVRGIKGNVSCSVMIVCYWAGKAFVWDAFALSQRVATGHWSQKELDRRAREARIRFETIDDRTTW